ncbi:hypothetical protein E3N88_18680 [Mikania micrantha]|uniref:Chaperone DnaJ C-terminal domain-containing protein n=1 Tax=Mikania micrantha TaxID=192012 RepID=A0A5N6NLK3_9ASTR|nr:hypothetical protein E3N88_18680 [Mikania micrantha]
MTIRFLTALVEGFVAVMTMTVAADSIPTMCVQEHSGNDIGIEVWLWCYKFYTGDMQAEDWFKGQCHGCGVHTCEVDLASVMQPDTVIGDIVFVLQQKKHPKFKRKRDDIFVVHTLSLTEELCGFQFILTHLYNRSLNLERSIQGDNDEGMLKFLIPFMRGSFTSTLQWNFQTH